MGLLDSPTMGSYNTISSPLTYIVYLLPFLSYLAGPKSVSVRSFDKDTMRNTAVEATASSSGNNNNNNNVLLDAEHKYIST